MGTLKICVYCRLRLSSCELPESELDQLHEPLQHPFQGRHVCYIGVVCKTRKCKLKA